jgi:Tol biopolymer transport system component/DNA-binding winged helix-turn-helix (wHTH) protein
MQVLVELAARPGEVVHKEELMQRVWPNTFVGDDVLTRCVYELRRVFDDKPRDPRVIQTVSKIGYRLIAQITPIPVPIGEPSAEPSAAPAQASNSDTVPPTPQEPLPASQDIQTVGPLLSRPTIWTAVALAVLVLTLGGIWAMRANRAEAPQAATFKAVPFTSYPGAERQPAFSPMGDQIAFTWNGEDNGESWSIYVKLIGSEAPLRLTKAPAEDMSPAWSPDGKWIAFIRRSHNGNFIYMVPAIGGPERKLFDLHCAIDWDEPGLSWSPDGKSLVFPDGKSEDNPSSLVSLSLETLRTKPVTFPMNSWDGDYSPAFSPDGTKIAFVRGTDVGSRDVYIVETTGGEPVKLTAGHQQIHGLAWTVNGNAIVFSSNAGGGVSLWRVPVSGGEPQRLPFGSDRAFTPTIAPKGDRLAYSQGSDTWSVMRVDMKSPHSTPVRLISSTEQDSAPQLSHDTKFVAFQSRRSGSQEIWVSSTSAASPVKLTSFNGPMTGSPSWSPDDRQIAFDSRTEGRSHIFVIDANGGPSRRLTEGQFNDILPNWSKDGNWIYFSSKRTGKWQVWRASVNSTQVEQVTKHGGFVAKESPDGRWLYYTKYDTSGLWRVPLFGGEEAKILNEPPVGYWGYFSVSSGGVYFLNLGDTSSSIDFYDSSRNTRSTIYTLSRPPVRFSSLTVSDDGRWILYTDAVSRYRDLFLTENFH